MRIVSTLAGVLLLSGCLSSTEPDMKWADPATIRYASELGVNLAEMTLLSSGVYVQDLEIGEGEKAVREHAVTVRYTGWLPDGSVFDTTQNDNPRGPWTLTELGVVGWAEGIPGMLVGGKRRLVIPPELAYGAGGYGSIPPYATLIFDIELISVQVPDEAES